MERKRAAQQEEARRQDQLQRQEIERQRERERTAAVEDPKKVSQKQAIEKRRLELQKKDARPTNRPANDMVRQLQCQKCCLDIHACRLLLLRIKLSLVPSTARSSVEPARRRGNKTFLIPTDRQQLIIP